MDRTLRYGIYQITHPGNDVDISVFAGAETAREAADLWFSNHWARSQIITVRKVEHITVPDGRPETNPGTPPGCFPLDNHSIAEYSPL